ncbi:MAG TPA: phage holin family protein [Bryobacteraceae bacterium]|nr:phage holin family protein [Bryobacteraceae bacterium]
MDPARDAAGNLGSYAYTKTEREGTRPIADVLKQTVTNVQEIIRSEVLLAKVELKEESRKATSAGKMFGASMALAFFGLGFCLLSAVYALSLVLPAWAAALIVGVVLLIFAGGALAMGRERWKNLKAPAKTMFTVKEDVEWMRNQFRS